MLLMQQHQDGLTRRLSVIGIPTYTINPFVRDLVRWENCSGVEWTIKRLKSLKVDLIRQQSGLEPLCSSWVSKNRKGQFSGTIGSLFRWASLSERNFSKVVQAFMAYTFYIHPSLTEEQKKKFLDGINPVNPSLLSKKDILSFQSTVKAAIRRRSIGVNPRPLVVYQGSPDKKAPRLNKPSTPQDSNILDELNFFSTPSGVSLYREFRDLYHPLLKGIGSWQSALEQNYSASNADPDYIWINDYTVRGGEIHFLQEPGGKLRSIASPFRIHQEALRPLGEELYRLIQQLPWDCTFDQTKAHPHIQSHLRTDETIHCVDLSSATDHFPLSLQETALKAIFIKENWDHIDLFIKISRAVWKSPLGDLQWTKGQPLGLYPSFGAFTLTHGLLLLHLNGGEHNNEFFVVGDDVVILKDSLYESYIDVLDRMSCPWSSDKSISSSKLAEFAGKIITPTMVIPQLKWRRLSNDNFLDICRLLGRKSRCLLSRRQKRVFDSVAFLCDPIGLNFSLPGDNLTKMVERTLDFYQPEKVVLESLMGLRKRFHAFAYTSAVSLNSDELEEIAVTFDEKVKSALSETVFSRWSTSCSIGVDAFSMMPQALDLKPRLPLKVQQTTRSTQLDRYERLINRK